MTEVTAYDGSRIDIPGEMIEHVTRKHPQMLSLASLTGERLLRSVVQALENPNEVFVDDRDAKYFLIRVNALYLNVIVSGGVVRTAYLIGEQRIRGWRRRDGYVVSSRTGHTRVAA